MSTVKHPYRAAPDPVWKLEDAKARFSELVKLAEQGVPQRVSVRGRDAVVILSAEAYRRLEPAASRSLAALFGEGPFTRLDELDDVLVREPAVWREPETFEP
jgi:prevent-host-death family protein